MRRRGRRIGRSSWKGGWCNAGAGGSTQTDGHHTCCTGHHDGSWLGTAWAGNGIMEGHREEREERHWLEERGWDQNSTRSLTKVLISLASRTLELIVNWWSINTQ